MPPKQQYLSHWNTKSNVSKTPILKTQKIILNVQKLSY